MIEVERFRKLKWMDWSYIPTQMMQDILQNNLGIRTIRDNKYPSDYYYETAGGNRVKVTIGKDCWVIYIEDFD